MSENALQHRFALASHWLELGNAERCLEVLADAGPEAAQDLSTFVLQAGAYLELDDPVRARQAAERGLAIDAEDPRLLELLGIAAARQGALVDAERAFLDGLRQEPSDPYLLARYALVVARAGQLDKARQLVEKAARSGPEEAFVAQVRSLVAYLQGDEKEAASLGSAALSHDPENAGIHALMGSYLLSGGAVGKATEHHLTSAGADPGDSDLAHLGREAKYLRHPLMRPIWLVEKFGPGKIWITYLLVFLALQAIGLGLVALLVAGSYLLFVIYSWVVPQILRRRYGLHR